MEALGLHLFVAWFQRPLLNRWPHLHSLFLVSHWKGENYNSLTMLMKVESISVFFILFQSLSLFLWVCSWVVWVLQVCSPSVLHASTSSFAFCLVVSLCGCYLYVYVQVYIPLCMESRGQCWTFSSLALFFETLSLSEPEAHQFS